jgi:integrase
MLTAFYTFFYGHRMVRLAKFKGGSIKDKKEIVSAEDFMEVMWILRDSHKDREAYVYLLLLYATACRGCDIRALKFSSFSV